MINYMELNADNLKRCYYGSLYSYIHNYNAFTTDVRNQESLIAEMLNKANQNLSAVFGEKIGKEMMLPEMLPDPKDQVGYLKKAESIL